MGNKCGFKIGGKWIISCYNKAGVLKWKEYIFNKVVNETLDNIMLVYFDGGTQFTSRYVLLYDSDVSPIATWTYANIGSDFNEFVDYDEATRVLWDFESVGTGSYSNISTPSEFTASTGVDTILYGAALVNVLTKDDNLDANGLIFCATRFSQSRPFVETDVIKVVYTLSVASAT